MNNSIYLERLGFNNELKPSLETLCKLQETHLKKIPFENLDIHNGTEIILDIAKISNKILNKNRGGFCYELNGLFFELLTSLGFQSKRISARVFSEEKGYGKEFDHLAIIVNLNDAEYLTDVGFGEFTMQPIKFKLDLHQKDQNGTFFIDQYDHNYFRINKIENVEVTPQYIFTTTARDLSEFNDMCNFHQRSNNSHFTQKKIITKCIQDGRITLTNDKLKIRSAKNIDEVIVKSEKQFDQHLKTYFDIKIEH